MRTSPAPDQGGERSGIGRERVRPAYCLALLLLGLVLVPFALFGSQLEALTATALARADGDALLVAMVVVLLAADMALPIPSSVVSLAAGAALGLWLGALSIAVGLSLGAVAAFLISRRWGYGFAIRWLGAARAEDFMEAFERHSVLLILLCRPVPVLAETSVIALGAARAKAGTAIAAIVAANAILGVFYAALGARASAAASLGPSLIAAALLPACAWLAARWLMRRSKA